jgi:hypothetical protein
MVVSFVSREHGRMKAPFNIVHDLQSFNRELQEAFVMSILQGTATNGQPGYLRNKGLAHFANQPRPSPCMFDHPASLLHRYTLASHLF